MLDAAVRLAGRVIGVVCFEHVGDEPAKLERSGFRVFLESLRLLWTCLLESPEVTARRRTRELGAGGAR